MSNYCLVGDSGTLIEHVWAKMVLVLVITLGLSLGLTSCANMQAPSGGPRDSTPPMVVEFTPVQNSREHKTGRIRLLFNKWVNRGKVLENVRMTPDARLKFDWDGKLLNIEPADSLEDNTTYTLSLDASYTDVDNNKPTQSFSLTFSTGAVLDSASIWGRLVDPKPDGVSIFAYPLFSVLADTLDPGTRQPRYRIQCGTTGTFVLRGLRAGPYAVFAVRDEAKNNLIDVERDQFGTSTRPVVASEDADSVLQQAPYLFRLNAIRDTTRPTIVRAQSIDQRRVVVEFSEQLDSLSINTKTFLVSDSATGAAVDVSAVSWQDADTKGVAILCSQVLSIDKRYRLSLSVNSGFQRPGLPTDRAGNMLMDTTSVYFRGDAKGDSVKWTTPRFSVKDSALDQSVALQIRCDLSTEGATESFKHCVRLRKQAGDSTIAISLVPAGNRRFYVRPESGLESNSWYELELRTAELQVQSSTKPADTTYRVRFRTVDTRQYGNLGLTVVDTGGQSKRAFGVDLIGSDQQLLRSIVVNSNTQVIVKDLSAGEVSIRAFYDRNGNGRYDAGSFLPYVDAEPFSIHDKKVMVKARWTIEGVKVDAP